MLPVIARAGIIPTVVRAAIPRIHTPLKNPSFGDKTTEVVKSRSLPAPIFADATFLTTSLLPHPLASSETGIIEAKSPSELRPGTFFRIQLSDGNFVWLRRPDIFANSMLSALRCCMPKEAADQLAASTIYDVTQVKMEEDGVIISAEQEEVRFYSGPDIIFADRRRTLTYPAPHASPKETDAIKFIRIDI